MEHYWNAEIDENFKPELFEFLYKDKRYSMYSSEAVFSSFRADTGSLILTDATLDFFEKKPFLSSIKALDVGCGQGLISILIADKLDKFSSDLIDISPRALRLAQMNIEKFGLVDRLRVFESDIYSKVSDKYNLIFTNPPIRAGKVIVHQILEESYRHLDDAGYFLAVIRKQHGALSGIKKLKEVYGNCEILKRSKGFYVIISQKK